MTTRTGEHDREQISEHDREQISELDISFDTTDELGHDDRDLFPRIPLHTQMTESSYDSLQHQA